MITGAQHPMSVGCAAPTHKVWCARSFDGGKPCDCKRRKRSAVNGDNVQEAKRRLPLPQLMQELGHGDRAKKVARCPFHSPDRNPSFSVFEKDGQHFWKCHAGCGEGDEIDFLSKAKGIDAKEATREFLRMACLGNNNKRHIIVKDSGTSPGRGPHDSKIEVTNEKPNDSEDKRPDDSPPFGKNSAITWADDNAITWSQNSYAPPKQILESWHHAELVAFISLGGNAERKGFVIARKFAEIAAKKGEPDFALATSEIARVLNVRRERAGRIRSSLVRKGVIIETSPYSRAESKSARYRWALETTLPIPPMPPEQDDDDEESLF